MEFLNVQDIAVVLAKMVMSALRASGKTDAIWLANSCRKSADDIAPLWITLFLVLLPEHGD